MQNGYWNRLADVLVCANQKFVKDITVDFWEESCNHEFVRRTIKDGLWKRLFQQRR